MPHRRTVAASMLRKMKFSTISPIRITVKQAREHGGNVEHVLVLVDVPAEPALAGRDAEHQLGRDQRAPGERPADLQSGQDRGERGRDQDLRDVARAAQAVVAPDHAQRIGHRAEARVGVERHRPQHRVHQHENDGDFAQPEPDQRERQQRDRGQRVERRGQRLQEVVADARHHRERGEQHGESEPDGIALEQQEHRVRHLLREVAAHHGGPECLERGGEGRHQQRVVELARVELPAGGDDHEDERLPAASSGWRAAARA